MKSMLSAEQLIELAYELFLESAADHLPPEDIVDVTLEFEERGTVESCPPSNEWHNEVPAPYIPAEWLEIWIGLLDHQDEFCLLFAKILVPKSGERQQAIIHWKPTL